MNKLSKIVKTPDKKEWCVKSESNPDWNGGCYDSKSKAEKRLKQVEAFKHMRKSSKFGSFKIATEVVIEDRYSALGIPRPDTKTMCKGQCEGTGFVPIEKSEKEEPWKSLWDDAEEKSPSDDGWHFVTCPDCNGTGKTK